MSRIIAGAAGGTTLVSVPGSLTRPTTDRVKEALFSRLDAFDVIADARVLDLYAGSGSLGVESASRGAESVDLVEFDGKASEVCQRNADLVNTVARRKVVSVHRSKVESFLERTQRRRPLGPRLPRSALPPRRARAGRGAGQAAPAPGRGRRRRGGALVPGAGTVLAGGHGAVRGTEVRRDQTLVRRTRRGRRAGGRALGGRQSGRRRGGRRRLVNENGRDLNTAGAKTLACVYENTAMP